MKKFLIIFINMLQFNRISEKFNTIYKVKSKILIINTDNFSENKIYFYQIKLYHSKNYILN